MGCWLLQLHAIRPDGVELEEPDRLLYANVAKAAVSCGTAGCQQGSSLFGHCLAEFLVRRKAHPLLGGHLDLGTGLGIDPRAGSAGLHRKGAKANQAHFVARLQGIADRIEGRVDDLRRLLVAFAGAVCNR
jgi:hypothetical protein